jgi:hypothetical protein
MSVYVDRLRDWGWRLGPSSHLITDEGNEVLHAFAASIGLRKAWFQPSPSGVHYDLCASKRRTAVALGAIELDDASFHAILKAWRGRAVAAVNAAVTEEEKAAVRMHLFR